MTGQELQHLIASLHSILLKKPGLNKHHLLQRLSFEGWAGITTSEINKVLYNYPGLFKHGAESLPLWYAKKQSKKHLDLFLETKKPSDIPELYNGPPLRDWQMEAFASWKAAGRRGVVEAVTGTGKTAVGTLAAADALSRGFKVLILVPGVDLLNQWHEKLSGDLPAIDIGRFGGKNKDSLENFEIIISTVQSACRSWMLSEKTKGLIIADEVHRYGAERYFLALEESFDERIGLTATFEREDNKVEEVLAPYFSPNKTIGKFTNAVIFNCGYARGLGDGILAPFKVGFLGVDFSFEELEEYDRLDEQLTNTRKKLISLFGCPKEPFGEFIKAVTLLSEGNNENNLATKYARIFLSAFTKRRALLAGCDKKTDALKRLKRVFKSSERALVFTETVESARMSAEAIRGLGVSAFEYSSDIHRDDLEVIMKDFQAGLIKVLTAPHKLDEGIDVPEADVGVILASSRTRRQMIQRMGRIIRPKEDGRTATFFILYVRDTYEDPAIGAHGAFINEIIDFAKAIEYFESDVKEKDLLNWYVS